MGYEQSQSLRFQAGHDARGTFPPSLGSRNLSTQQPSLPPAPPTPSHPNVSGKPPPQFQQSRQQNSAISNLQPVVNETPSNTRPGRPTQQQTINQFLNKNQPPPDPDSLHDCPSSAVQLEGIAIDELRRMAQEQSKKVMTHEDELFFFELYQAQQLEISKAAIRRKVSVGMVEHLL